jgi:hypothetical protein
LHLATSLCKARRVFEFFCFGNCRFKISVCAETEFSELGCKDRDAVGQRISELEGEAQELSRELEERRLIEVAYIVVRIDWIFSIRRLFRKLVLQSRGTLRELSTPKLYLVGFSQDDPKQLCFIGSTESGAC